MYVEPLSAIITSVIMYFLIIPIIADDMPLKAQGVKEYRNKLAKKLYDYRKMAMIYCSILLVQNFSIVTKETHFLFTVLTSLCIGYGKLPKENLGAAASYHVTQFLVRLNFTVNAINKEKTCIESNEPEHEHKGVGNNHHVTEVK